ncbi:hypothetical protein QLL95_gp0608 [Cotonvirus japonicus]|uniref:Uncharacterized protein n=1 Tax=Cotonvirus japonicus TaxID=2811091 RepID=A0ABM7NTM0_9VIRU|nr:hypothetical protein QLL95_gp0608 [Cotonvirus japonicus]BCS83515.1 hypothetical protein [Cotonvirus japonicus]
MKRALHLKNREMNWCDFTNKKIYNDIVILDGYPGINPTIKPYFTCKTLFVDSCDKNFVYYFIDKSSFPFVKNLYLGSHPCEPEVLWRKFDNIYLLDKYSTYKERWSKNNDNIKIISDTDFIKELQDHRFEDIKLSL